MKKTKNPHSELVTSLTAEQLEKKRIEVKDALLRELSDLKALIRKTETKIPIQPILGEPVEVRIVTKDLSIRSVGKLCIIDRKCKNGETQSSPPYTREEILALAESIKEDGHE